MAECGRLPLDCRRLPLDCRLVVGLFLLRRWKQVDVYKVLQRSPIIYCFIDKVYNSFFSSCWIFWYYNIVYCLLDDNLVLTIGANKCSIVLECALDILSICMAYV